MDKFLLKDSTYFQDVKLDPKDTIKIEVGDSKQLDFKPQFKIMRWDNEVNFSMRAEEKIGATFTNTNGVIKYITPEYEVHQYEKLTAGEDGGFEFEWVFGSKPLSNVLSATIQTKGLDFFYQPELTEKEKLHKHRPDNVTGSYAVYHSSKGGLNNIDGKEYRTGKAFHIYRPEAVDTNGVRVWCDLNIDERNGLLSVTVPQTFLDNAVYPVTVDPTFGYTSIGATTNDFGGNVLYAKAASLPDYNGAMTSMSIYGQIFSGTPDFNPALYTDSASAPDSRLAFVASGGTSYAAGASWITTNITYSSITRNTQYWLGFLSTGVGPLVYEDTGGSATLHYGSGNTWNATADDIGNESGIYSIYATFTANPEVSWIVA